MGRDIAVVTDSNSGITQKQAERMGVSVIPMPFDVDGTTYFEDISLTQEQFYEKLAQGADIVTSQPSPEAVMSLWDHLLESHDEIVHIPMSSGLSGSCETAMMLAADYEGRVQVVDNQRISVTQRQSVLDAQHLSTQGLTAAQIRSVLEKKKMESGIYIMVDTLKYLAQRRPYHTGSRGSGNRTASQTCFADPRRPAGRLCKSQNSAAGQIADDQCA